MKPLLIVVFFLCGIALNAQSGLLKPARVIFYNTENLFDTIDDPKTKDEEFLPQSRLRWNTEKYQLKMKRISRVLGALLDSVQPLAIGMAEVENRKVLEDLIAQPALKKFNLGIIHRDSPDERGIDVALLYNKDVIENSLDAYLKIDFPFTTVDRTRDIIYLKGYVNEGEPLWIFVNHWPSRREGKEKSEKKRLVVEKTLKDKIDNVYLGEPFARVIVMGDFNDNPADESMKRLSAAEGVKNSGQAMVNLMQPLYEKKEFTVKYQNAGNIFDQFVVSKNLLDTKAPYRVRNAKATIYSPSWLLYKSKEFGAIPDRTYASGRWVKGYSDHLPVYLDIVFK